MTLEQANEIRRLLNFRDTLISQLTNLTKCESIGGHISDGVNGLGFKWEKNSRQIQYLIEGTTKEIKDVEEIISSFQTKGG